MIYIFNSAYRDRYRVNVLNTLFLPSGATNKYRYRYTGDYAYVAPAKVAAFKTMQGGEVAVIFIDRFGPRGYEYMPLRLGTLVKCWTDTDQIFFRVKLTDFIAPHSPAVFSERFTDAMKGEGIPRLMAGDPLNTRDGYYAVTAPSVFSDREQYSIGDEAWQRTANDLSTKTAFKRDPAVEGRKDHVLFTRATLRKMDSDKPLQPTALVDDEAEFRVERGTGYTLDLRYMNPAQKADPAAPALLALVKPSDTVKVQQNSPIRIDSYTNTTSIIFSPKRYAEDDHASLGLDYQWAIKQDIPILVADAQLHARLREPIRFWAKTVAASALFVVGGALLAMTFSPGEAVSWSTVIRKVTPLRVVGAAMQAAALFFLARVVGKKIF